MTSLGLALSIVLRVQTDASTESLCRVQVRLDSTVPINWVILPQAGVTI
jgi:hypothetical protein